VGGGSTLITEDDTESQDLDGIEKIEEHRNEDGVEHASKLNHPDDDDAAVLDSGDTASNENAQIQIKGTKDEDDTDNLARPQDSKENQPPVETSKKQTPWSERYDFPSWDECQELKEKAEELPDLIHVPFEVSVKDVVLEGWEDEWISKARYSGPKLDEPKIDFVYTCEHCCGKHNVAFADHNCRGERIAARACRDYEALRIKFFAKRRGWSLD
jgi:hypothetical protein